MAASSSSPQDPPPNPTPQPSSRRLPPPCWTHEETVALIDAYREKWYSLRLGTIRASHWQEVADSVAGSCRFQTPSKTSVQCRHKIEKLRKRYRTEKQRSLSSGSAFSWVYYRRMDLMETGRTGSRNPTAAVGSDSEDDNDGGGDKGNTRSLNRLLSNGSRGVRIRIPPPQTGIRSKSGVKVEENSDPNPRYNLKSSSSSRLGFEKKNDPVSEMVLSIRMLGKGFIRMEQMKMEMAKETERMRMDMEMKRTEMILESQQRIVDAFTRGFGGKKKAKRMPENS